MSAKQVVIVGAGGFGREVLDVLNAANEISNEWIFEGFVADDPPPKDILNRINAQWLSAVDEFLTSNNPDNYVIGIGNPLMRRSIASRFDQLGWNAATLIHPSAAIGADVEIAAGSVICSHVSITTNVRIGRHVHVSRNSTIGHDCRVSDFVTINPIVAVSGDVKLHEGVTMGTHSSILQGLSVGAGATVGAGAVVVRDVAPNSTVVGIPAKPLG